MVNDISAIRCKHFKKQHFFMEEVRFKSSDSFAELLDNGGEPIQKHDGKQEIVSEPSSIPIYHASI
jgi:hypothetical protein